MVTLSISELGGSMSMFSKKPISVPSTKDKLQDDAMAGVGLGVFLGITAAVGYTAFQAAKTAIGLGGKAADAVGRSAKSLRFKKGDQQASQQGDATNVA